MGRILPSLRPAGRCVKEHYQDDSIFRSSNTTEKIVCKRKQIVYFCSCIEAGTSFSIHSSPYNSEPPQSPEITSIKVK